MTMSLFAAVLAMVQVFVSPEGNDGNPGSEARPLRTLAGARDALRRARAADPQAFAAGGAEVIVGDGVYLQPKPLALAPEDGGAAGRPVVWRAAHRGKAVVSGGVALSAWRPVEDAKVLDLLGAEARRHVRVADLAADGELPGFTTGGCGTPERLREVPISVFCDGRRLPQARWPNGGFVRTGPNVGKIEKSHDATFCKSGVFEFDNPRLARWAREPDLWMFGLWVYEWADATVRVKGIDVGAKQVSVDPAPIGFGIRVGGQFRALNALSEIDEPGEWTLDRAHRRLYCWLPRADAEVTVALAEGLVRAEGTSHLELRDLVFAYARKTAIGFRQAKNCTVSGSTVRHTSSWGVQVRGGADDRIVGCDLSDLGEGGIDLCGGDLETLEPSRHVADNNHIHHYGQIVPNYRPGVQLSGVGNRATHNLIHHTLHQAIAFGGNDHYIGFNVCHDCCMFNDDAGTIYCCQRDWRRRGTVIEHNLIHMTGKQPRGTHTEGIYLDDFSSGVLVRNNIINRASFGVYVGGGQDCETYGNLVFNCTKGLSIGSRGIETFARNISGQGFKSGMFRTVRKALEGPRADLWRRRYPKMDGVLGFTDGQAAHNAHWNVVTNNVLVGCRGIEKCNWKNIAATCCVTDNFETAEDPGVTDYFGMDWSFRPGSEAARRLGDLKFGEMGLYASPLRASPAVRYGEGLVRPRPIGAEYDLASVRVDVPFLGTLPPGQTVCATETKGCKLPGWGRGKRIEASFGTADLKDWQDYRFAFTPTVTGDFEIAIMGMRGEKTLYDDFRVEGAALTDGGFERGRGWWVPKSLNVRDHRYSVCNTQRPWGVITAAEAGVAAAEGAKMWCGNDLIGATQRIRCTAGVPVTVSFKARALPIPK